MLRYFTGTRSTTVLLVYEIDDGACSQCGQFGTRCPMSWLKGPMTPRELALLRETTAPR